ncbi:MAG TPA: DUF2782 domain-containing protein [Burkholderiales bacterium]|nr:DUF2782 domain-containing protein [Burkholderiales bacterium]
MRRALLALACAAALAAGATARAQDRPPKLEPLPEAPPPPTIQDGADQPRVRIAPPDNESKVEQVPGGLKVTPPNGPPYYLIEIGPNEWARRDTLDPGVRVPMWTITTFD